MYKMYERNLLYPDRTQYAVNEANDDDTNLDALAQIKGNTYSRLSPIV